MPSSACKKENTALDTATAPNNPPACPFFLRVMYLAPAMRLDRAVGGEEAERADRHEIDDVLEIERPAAERVEVADGAEIRDHLARRALGLGGGPADDPGHEQDHEGDEGRDHLALGERADEGADRRVGGAEEEEPQVPEQDAPPLDAALVAGHQLHEE